MINLPNSLANKIIPVNTWEECLSTFKILEAYRIALRQAAQGSIVSPLLYRGQANAEKWKLETTLERRPNDKRISFYEYYRVISKIRPEIESFTGKVCEIPSLSDFGDWLRSADFSFQFKQKFPGIEYIVYLRHHGFPSPLLDWTRSPLIAAFFAFCDIAEDVQNVSIYAYMEHAGQGKSHSGNNPITYSIGPYIRTHKRHFLQQCEYTLCTVKDGNEIFFACHEDVFSGKGKEEGQDLLWKINIPSPEKFKVLTDLNSMNINSFSLFGTEESLMATLALKEFYLV